MTVPNPSLRYDLGSEVGVNEAERGGAIAMAPAIVAGNNQDLVLIENARTSQIAFYVSGFEFPGMAPGANSLPMTIHWMLFPGLGCATDDTPVCDGDTVLTVLSNTLNRQGLLFQVSGRNASFWLLRAYAVQVNSTKIKFRCSVLATPAYPSGGLSIEAGPVIG